MYIEWIDIDYGYPDEATYFSLWDRMPCKTPVHDWNDWWKRAMEELIQRGNLNIKGIKVTVSIVGYRELSAKEFSVQLLVEYDVPEFPPAPALIDFELLTLYTTAKRRNKIVQIAHPKPSSIPERLIVLIPHRKEKSVIVEMEW